MNQISERRTDKIILISCCAGHRIDRPFRMLAGKAINFIANPTDKHRGEVPDGLSDNPGQTWRDRLIQFNEKKGTGFPFSLYLAKDLYVPYAPYENIYTKLAEEYEYLYIFSAGWGIIRKDYLIPNYDITFQPNAENYKRRREMWADSIPINDFNHLINDFGAYGERRNDDIPAKEDLPIHFLAGTSYRKPFLDLTSSLSNEIIIRYYGTYPLLSEKHQGLKINNYEYASGRKVNRYTWIYQCAQEEYLNDIGLTLNKKNE